MYDHDIMIVKLDKLYWRVHGRPGARKINIDRSIRYFDPTLNSKDDDLTWCRRILNDAHGGIIPNKEELRQSNELWKKYKY